MQMTSEVVPNGSKGHNVGSIGPGAAICVVGENRKSELTGRRQ
jgi:hypothetical protein